ncbi:complement C1q tumor necrosis factor-related protein 7-like [Mya arenaria]|uniref:complement C1q tumor necrosis factor-related protein 7-like n=1 Tax=Mya arenaria TaxID=6604 RepID=UPI0022E405F5|nr:complement C1q tumor necrosis factor-related protein 7-like [Mya arenaria]
MELNWLMLGLFCAVFDKCAAAEVDDGILKTILERLEKTENELASSRNELKQVKEDFEIRLKEAENGIAFVNRTSNEQEEMFAFTSYLDHNLDHLGIDHPIVFNKVLLNEGSAYNPANGMFTCQIDGLYVLSFFVADFARQQVVARLSVNGVNQVDAIADTSNTHQYMESQGGNLAVVRLTAGQAVWIASYRHPETSVYATGVDRLSTFSGFLLLG